MILYTSGTTGRPKGVVSTHAGVTAQVRSLVEAWEWTPEDRILLVLPLHHVHGIVNVLGCALASGACCTMLERFEAETVWTCFAERELTLFMAVPTIYAKLIACWEAGGPDRRRAWSEAGAGLRLAVSGSAALPRAVLERWREITTTGMVLSQPLHGTRRAGTVGRALGGVEVRRLDALGRPASPEEPGEIEVRGPGVFLEYWNRPDETAAAFHDGWFRTGDIAVVEDGDYRILGRRGIDLIKTGGYKVSALEVEECLRAHPAVADCAVVGVADPVWGERVA
jgi:malonyl-CoA/methylmalonyl-CoA synthetase